MNDESNSRDKPEPGPGDRLARWIANGLATMAVAGALAVGGQLWALSLACPETRRIADGAAALAGELHTELAGLAVSVGGLSERMRVAEIERNAATKERDANRALIARIESKLERYPSPEDLHSCRKRIETLERYMDLNNERMKKLMGEQ